MKIAAEEVENAELKRSFIKNSRRMRPEKQALGGAAVANRHGYHLALLSLGGLNHYTDAELIAHVKAVAAENTCNGILFTARSGWAFIGLPVLERVCRNW